MKWSLYVGALFLVVQHVSAQFVVTNRLWPMREGGTIEWRNPPQEPSVSIGRFVPIQFEEGFGLYHSLRPGTQGVIADATGIFDFLGQPYTGSRRRIPARRNVASSSCQVVVVPDPANPEIAWAVHPPEITMANTFGGYQTHSLTRIDTRQRVVTDMDTVVWDPTGRSATAMYPNPWERRTEYVGGMVDHEQRCSWIVYPFITSIPSFPTRTPDTLVLYAYRIDENGIHMPVRSAVQIDMWPRSYSVSQMVFSVQGMYVLIEDVILKFDSVTGHFIFHKRLAPKSGTGNAPPRTGCFSPSGRYIYAAYEGGNDDGQQRLLQYDLHDSKDTLSPVIVATIPEGVRFGPSGPAGVRTRIGPDCRIYVSMREHIGVVEHPDLPGVAAGFNPIRYDAPAQASDDNSGLLLSLPDLINQLTFPYGQKSCLWPSASFTLDTACAGSCITVRETFDNDVREWLWSFPGGQPSAYIGQHPPCIRYDVPGDHPVTLIVRNAYGADTVTGRAVVLPPPAVSAGPDVSVCTDGEARLAATGAVSYLWTPSAGLDDTTSATPLVRPLADSTAYVVTGTDERGCVAMDTVVVRRGRLHATVSAGATICSGSSVRLHAAGGVVYRWWPAAGLDDPTSPTPLASPAVTTIYHVEVSSGSCVDTAVVTVTVRPLPVVTISSGDTTVCIGSSVRLAAAVVNGTAILWLDEAGTTIARSDVMEIMPARTMRYRAIGTLNGADGCADTAVVTVTVVLPPLIRATPDTTICWGDSITLMATVDGSAVTTIEWYDQAWRRLGNGTTVTTTPAVAMRYHVVATGSSGCADTATVAVMVAPRPVLRVRDTTICAGEEAMLEATGGSGAVVWRQKDDDRIIGTGRRLSVRPAATSAYVAMVTTDEGCTAEADGVVTVTSAGTTQILMGDGKGQPGTRITTTVDIMTTGLPAGPLVLRLTDPAPMARLVGVTDGRILADGPGEPVVQFDGPGRHILSWDLFIAARQEAVVDGRMDDAGSCVRVTVTPARLSLEGCAVTRRVIRLGALSSVSVRTNGDGDVVVEIESSQRQRCTVMVYDMLGRLESTNVVDATPGTVRTSCAIPSRGPHIVRVLTPTETLDLLVLP